MMEQWDQMDLFVSIVINIQPTKKKNKPKMQQIVVLIEESLD